MKIDQQKIGDILNKEICFSGLTCPFPKTPEHGQLHLTNRYVNGTATVSCEEGYFYNGTEIWVCQLDGQWSGTGGTCQGKGDACDFKIMMMVVCICK